MVSVNQRGWTATATTETSIDDDTPRSKAVVARCDALMAEWSSLHHDEEQEGWRRQADMEDGNFPTTDWYRICDCDVERVDGLCQHDRAAIRRTSPHRSRTFGGPTAQDATD